jgi:hypothetical protein
MKNRSNASKKWFWAWLVQMTAAKSAVRDPSARTAVWRNLVIIQATGAVEALDKAYAIGKSESGDCRGTLRLNEKPAATRFLGVADMGLIYDDLGDGAEILWQLRKCSQATAKSLILSSSRLLSRLKGDLRAP